MICASPIATTRFLWIEVRSEASVLGIKNAFDIYGVLNTTAYVSKASKLREARVGFETVLIT